MPAIGIAADAVGEQALEQRVQTHAADVLHDKVVVPVLLANAEDRHDVGVVELGRGARLALEPLAPAGVEQAVARQDLDRDTSREGCLLGLVDDAHAAASELAHDAEVAQAVKIPARAAGQGAGPCGRCLDAFDLQNHGEEFADLPGVLRVHARVLFHGRLLSTPAPLGEFGRQLVKWVPHRVVAGHVDASWPQRSCGLVSSGRRMPSMISFNRRSART